MDKTLNNLIKFGFGNAKLNNDTLTLTIPAGKTCPGANLCKAWAVRKDGKTKIVDGPDQEFRCFEASLEARLPNVYDNAHNNLKLIIKALRDSQLTQLFTESLANNLTAKTKKVRIHVGGDYFNMPYLDAWLETATRFPDLKFYSYSKSLHLFKDKPLPENFYLTASYGGLYDYLIDEGHFPRYSVVVMNEQEALERGLPIDHDDSHCFGDGPFALLVHGTQPAGSEYGKAIRNRQLNKEFVSYS